MLTLTLASSLAVQGIFFLAASRYRTDKVTDLSYALTFLVLTFLLVSGREDAGPAHWVLAGMVVVWAIRLGAYLFIRILRMKRDVRFDGIRERFWSFLRFWILQGLVVWAVMLPVILWFGGSPGRPGWMVPGFLIWAVGLVTETVADVQKFRQKARPEGARRWIESGLWRYSRHPNYLGELLCWWGVFFYVAPALGAWSALAALGPLSLTCLLLFVTGVPALERGADQKWGADAAYQAYKRQTPVLIPRLPVRRALRQEAG
jgi:steroid 5-alpha reductase family enzyme